MTPIAVTPWTARFFPLLDRAEIFQRALLGSPGLFDLDALPVDSACMALAHELTQVFYPTAQIIDVLHCQIEIALAHSLMTYPDLRSYTEGIYRHEPPLPTFVPLRCLTGLAGIGKSSLVKALQRVLPASEQRLVPVDEEPSPISTLWTMNVQVQSSLRDLFGAFGGSDGTLKNRIDTTRKRAYRDGVSLFIADEFQFLTSSSLAHTRVTQTLLSLGYCGLPAFYVANYSLLHRLLRRPQEDRDRLLCDVTILVPDLPASEDWMRTVALQIAVAPDVFQIDPETDAPQIHRLCAGLKRILANLLVITYRDIRQRTRSGERVVVRLKDLQAAYESVQFASHRIDVEIITQQTILNRSVDRRRSDLWCPIDGGEFSHAGLRAALIRQREATLANRIQDAAASCSERALAKNTNQAPLEQDNKKVVVKLPRPLRPSSTELKANAQRLMDDNLGNFPD